MVLIVLQVLIVVGYCSLSRIPEPLNLPSGAGSVRNRFGAHYY